MMNMDAYKDAMDSIEPPAHLKDKVLADARNLRASQAASRPQQKRRTPEKKRRFSLKIISLGAVAACACLVVVTLMGGGLVHPTDNAVKDKTFTPFSMYAYAAEREVNFASADAAIVFGNDGGGSATKEGGMYTGCLFGITGDDIVGIDVSISGGALYLYAEDLSTENDVALANAQKKLGGVYDPSSIGGSDTVLSAGRVLGQSASFSCGTGEGEIDLAQMKFGFWIAPEDYASTEAFKWGSPDWWHKTVDLLNGQTLTITAYSADGSQVTEAYILTTGKLKADHSGQGSPVVLPELASDDEPYVYGIYGTLVSS
jgi:hypothetical protein